MTSPHRLIALADSAAWSRALEGIPHSFWHRHDVCAVFSARGAGETFLYVYDDGDARVVCPLAERAQSGAVDVYTPYGFSGFAGAQLPAGFEASWNAFAAERGWVCGYLALHPMLGQAPANVPARQSLYVLDLRQNPEALWSGLSRGRRQQLRDWERIRETLVTDRKAVARYFIDSYPQFVQRVQAPRAQWFTRETLEALCSLDSVLMVGAGRPDAIEAAYLFGYTPHAGECLFNVAEPAGRDHASPMFWWGVEQLRERGVPSVNMGGSLREDDSLARSKQHFGAARVPFRRLKQIYRRDVYDRLCREAGHDPAADSDYFPPYRAPAMGVPSSTGPSRA